MNWAFLDELRARLAAHAAAKSAPIERFAPSNTRALRFQAPPPGSRDACVIVLLYPREHRWHIPLVVRPNALRHHGGQVALPGGAREPGESLAHTAVRELEEELGIPATCVELLGALSPFFVPVSSFQVHPWVGYIGSTPAFVPNRAEVEELLETPAAPILGLAALRCERRAIGGESADVPYFEIGQYKVWGATCIALGELATLCSGLEP